MAYYTLFFKKVKHIFKKTQKNFFFVKSSLFTTLVISESVRYNKYTNCERRRIFIVSPQGYLHNELDVKILILFILARINTPLDVDQVYEVAFQDDSLNYFMLAESLHELVDTGHLTIDAQNRYTITEKGRKQGSFVEDSLAVPVVEKVSAAIQVKLDQLRRESLLSTEVSQDDKGNWVATLRYNDNDLPLMTVSLFAPNESHGKAMAENMKKHITDIYKAALDAATDEKKNRSKRNYDS